MIYIQKTNLYDETINILKNRNLLKLLILSFGLIIFFLLYYKINKLYIKGLINNFMLRKNFPNSFQRKSN